MDFRQHVALVTGGGSGIGRQVSLQLGSLGARVAVLDLDGTAAESTSSEIIGGGGSALSVKADVSDFDEVAAGFDKIGNYWQAPTVVVNCAGWDRIQKFVDTDPAFWTKVISINYVGTLTVTQHAVRGMIALGAGGHIVNVVSDAARVGSSGEAVYAGAKGAAVAFTKSLAREVAKYGINVNAVAPGPTDTPLFYELDKKIRDSVVRAIPLGRIADPSEVAAVVAFLASDQASYVTGQVLSVSGGLTMAG